MKKKDSIREEFLCRLQESLDFLLRRVSSLWTPRAWWAHLEFLWGHADGGTLSRTLTVLLLLFHRRHSWGMDFTSQKARPSTSGRNRAYRRWPVRQTLFATELRQLSWGVVNISLFSRRRRRRRLSCAAFVRQTSKTECAMLWCWPSFFFVDRRRFKSQVCPSSFLLSFGVVAVVIYIFWCLRCPIIDLRWRFLVVAVVVAWKPSWVNEGGRDVDDK